MFLYVYFKVSFVISGASDKVVIGETQKLRFLPTTKCWIFYMISINHTKSIK